MSVTSTPGFSFQLALATSAQIPAIHADDAHLAASLIRLGVEPTPCIWSDPAVDWSRFDAVLIRTPWDYFQRFAEFTAWLDRLPIPTINAMPVLHWNADKRYLLELETLGVDIIPTRLVQGRELVAELASMAGKEIVIKPTVSGGAWHTVRGVAGEPDFMQAVAQLPVAFAYLIQPFVPEVVADGEWSLLYFDGHYSHAIKKRAAAGDYRVQALFGGSEEVIEPSTSIIASAEKALRAVATLGHADHAYVRVDGVVVDGRFLLMELEMIEPHLFLAHCPEAAERFASNLLRRLQAIPG